MTAEANHILLELGVHGMTCASCAARLERTLAKRPGVVAAEVQLVNERARVRVVPGTTIESVFAGVEAAGFEPRALPKKSGLAAFVDDEARFSAAAKRDGWLLLAAMALALPLVVPMLLMPFGLHWHWPPWVEFALATPVQFWLGARFYRAGAKALRHGSGNMDLLVAIGTSAAYFYSVAELVVADAPTSYFEASAVVIALVRLGKWLEAKAKRGTTAALRALLALQPNRVIVRRQIATAAASGHEDVELDAEHLDVGMCMVVRAGDRFAADAIVIDGCAAVDESMITGESLPVQRGPGQEVVGGSLNVNGYVVAQVLRVGEDATLGKIVQMVYGAQAGKANVQQLVDRISTWFVPIVLGIAMVTFVAWWLAAGSLEAAMVAAVSVLVIACPCALGLATPTAIVAGAGAAARAGILVRDTNTLEQASHIDTVVFDKTGTLTEGNPQVVSIRVTTSAAEAAPTHIDGIPEGREQGLRDPNGGETELLRLAASLEQASTHPLSAAIVAAAKARNLALTLPESFESHTGDGISGTIEGAVVRVGSLKWLVQCGVSDHHVVDVAPPSEQCTTVGVAKNDALLGVLSIADRPRDSAKAAVLALQRRKLRTILLSGDEERVARALGRELGLDDAIGGARPGDKQAIIRRLQAADRRVAMVGDGINDAPALATADIGIAVGSGTQVAMQTANIVVMRPDLRLIEATFALASATFAKIRQNLFWAFVYNCVGIPLAAAGRLSPMIAGLAMALSSVSVVSNSLLLRRWRP